MRGGGRDGGSTAAPRRAKRAQPGRAQVAPVVSRREPRRTLPVSALMVVVAAALAFGAALRAPLIFDDAFSITQNESINRLWPLSVPLEPPHSTPVGGRPVANLSFAVDHSASVAMHAPNSTVVYHATSLLLHVLTALVIFGLLRRSVVGVAGLETLDQGDLFAGAVALIWLVHPLQTEAVDYVTQRTELLVSFFYIATLYASARAWTAVSTRRRWLWYATGVIACAAGMGSKEVMVSAPIAVILYDRAFHASSWRDLWRSSRRWYYAALLATEAVLVTLIAAGGRTESAGFGRDVTWYEYLFTQCWAIAHYVRLAVWPVGLTLDYGIRPADSWPAVAGAVLLVVLAVATILAWRRDPRLGFVGVVFFMLLAPSSSVVPIRTELVAERRMYLALLCVVVALAYGVVIVWRRWRLARIPAVARFGLFAALMAVFVVLAFRRSRLYADPEALWRDSATRVPDNPRAYDNLAAVIVEESPARRPEAELLLHRAIATDSLYVSGWTNLAELQIEGGRLDSARVLLEHALRIKPDAVDATLKLGNVFMRLNQPAAAIPYLERFAREFSTVTSLEALSNAYLGTQNVDGAIATMKRLVALDPSRVDVQSTLGTLLVETGQPGEAIEHLEAAARSGPIPARTGASLSLAYARAGRAEEAARVAAIARERNSGDVQTDVQLGQAMLAIGDLRSAIGDFQRAVRDDPNNPEAITRLAIAEANAGNTGVAVNLLHRALSIAPGYPAAREVLSRLGQR